MAKSQVKKPLTINPSSSLMDILKPIANVGSAAFIVKAINEHTRAMIAYNFLSTRSVWKELEHLPFEAKMIGAFRLADEFLAAGKTKSDNTPADEAA